MVLESTVICIDNSEYMRNGDFVPNRLIAQQEAVSRVFYARTNDNPESTVALMTQSNPPQVLCTLTTDASHFISRLLLVQPTGEINLLTSIRIAQLVLKHRRARNHKMRIVVFVGSPLTAIDQTELSTLAKKLKKEKVNVDVINFGEESNVEQLNTFIKEFEGTSSYFISVPSGATLSDVITNTPIIRGDGTTNTGSIAANPMDIDPNQDPELAMALRISMEEQRQRMNVNTDDSANTNAINEMNTSGSSGTTSGTESETSNPDDALIEEAIAMSLREMDSSTENLITTSSSAKQSNNNDNAPDFASMTDEEQLNYVLQMSLRDIQKEKPVDTVSRVKSADSIGSAVKSEDSVASGGKSEDSTAYAVKSDDSMFYESDDGTDSESVNQSKKNKARVKIRKIKKHEEIKVDDKQTNKETKTAGTSDSKTKVVAEESNENTATKKNNRKVSPKTRLQKKKLKEHEEDERKNSGKKEKMETTDDSDEETEESDVEENVVNKKKTRKTTPNNNSQNKSAEHRAKKSKKDNKKQKKHTK